jgi:hypothetical protein
MEAEAMNPRQSPEWVNNIFRSMQVAYNEQHGNWAEAVLSLNNQVEQIMQAVAILNRAQLANIRLINKLVNQVNELEAQVAELQES